MTNHSLCEKPRKRRIEIEIATFTQRPHVEARVEEVEDRMFDAADVLIDRHPVIDCLALERDGRARRAEAQEEPGRLEERIQSISLAAGGPTTMRAIDMFPGRVMIERISRDREADILWKRNR